MNEADMNQAHRSVSGFIILGGGDVTEAEEIAFKIGYARALDELRRGVIVQVGTEFKYHRDV